MTKRTRTKKAKNVEAIIDPVAEMATSAAEVGIIDHGTQIGSWSPEAEEIGAVAPLDDAELGVIDALEESNAVRENEAVEAPEAPVLSTEATEQKQDWADVLQALDPEKVEETVYATAASLDDRAAFERSVDPGNANIHRTLKKARAQMVTKRAAKVMLATNVDPAFMNRSIQEGARYNVYAIGKFADLVYGLTDGAISNAINRAVTKSLFQCKNGGVPFTGEVARAAASDKVRIDSSIRKFLVSHTVSASTAPTQASSTMQALETLGVVKVEGSRRHPTYIVTDTPVARKLEELVLKAA